jgi:sirohydrochlorin cobaltochelatase
MRLSGASQITRLRQRRRPSTERDRALPTPPGANSTAAPARELVAPLRAVDDTVLLIGHGTRDLDGAAEFRAFAQDVERALGGSRPVVPCFLELAQPSILDALTGCLERGVHSIVAVPLLLFGANHVKNDIPVALNQARALHPELDLRYGAPLGVEPELLGILDERIARLEAALPARPRAETAVLLIERGSSDPDANGQVFHLARLLWEGRGFGWVETCFIGITQPSLEEGIERCLRLGARRVLVIPYFLFTGVLVRRIGEIVAGYRARHPELEFAVGEHLGRHPILTGLALRRIEQAGQERVHMSCDRCKYRVNLVGFEHQVGQPQTSDRAHGLRTGDGAHHHHHHDGKPHSH